MHEVFTHTYIGTQ